jgi:hypothetical protein
MALVLAVLEGAAEAAGASSPLNDAAAVWHMAGASDAAGKDAALTVQGKVTLGVELQGAERQASLRRGGDGRVARFEGGCLRAGEAGNRQVSLRGKEMTLCVRLQDSSGRWDALLFGKDDKDDKFGNMLYGREGRLHYVWRTEPAELRVLGISGSYGFNGESNDQHNLSAYQPGEFAISILTLDDAGVVTLFHNGRKNSGKIDITKQSVGNALFRVGAKHDNGEFLEGDIAEIIVYDRVVSEAERAAIEGCLKRKWGVGAAGTAAAGQALPASGLVLHLDADDVNADRDKPGKAGPLAAWKDKSGAGRVLGQGDGGKQPELVANALSGKAVVRFGGRHCLDGAPVLSPGTNRFTFIAVWKRNHASGSEVIFEQASPGAGKRACLLTTGKAESRGGDFADGVLRLAVPVAMIDPAPWHDVVVRFRGPNLELFVDGVLVDEEWPHGALYQFCGPFLIGAGYDKGELKTGFRGQIDHVALWNRALKDEEIVALAGGAEAVARRDREILGPPQASMQYWKPRGQAYAGDCIPFYHDGTFHLFYLFDRRHHGSKWGQGAHQYAHVTTKDLVHWEHQPPAVPIIEQWECSMGTGDVIWHDGVFHVFYTDCGGRCEYKDKPQRGSWIFAATSTDGVHFSKDLKPLVPGHDCEVFRDPATGLFHLVRGGGNRLVSKDLRHWEETPGDFVRRRPGTSDECPNHFEWNGWFYFILGTNALWKSRGALGPWEEISPDVYDGLFVPKVAEFTGNRRILAGFLTWPGWAGHVALRELVQYPDGSLGMKFPPELIPAAGEPVTPVFAALSSGATGNGTRIQIKAAGTLVAGMLSGVPKNVRITLRVLPQSGAKAFGLCVRGKGDYEGGCELRFEPGRQRAQYGVPENRGPAKDSSGPISQGRDFAIRNVKNLDRPFTLDIIVKDNIIDTCIDQRRTMISRRHPEPEGDRLFFFARGGEVAFEDILVRPLSAP